MESIYERLTIRPSVLDDLPEIVRLLVEDDLGQTREQYTPEQIPAGYRQAWEMIEKTAGNTVYVAELEGVIVGTFQLMFLPSLSFQGGTRAQIESVRIDQMLRGRGLGRVMMEWAVDEARTAGCTLVQLTTNKQRTRAQQFYERLGFQATHEGMKMMLR